MSFINREKFKKFLSTNKDFIQSLAQVVGRIFVVCILAYMLAAGLNLVLMNILTNKVNYSGLKSNSRQFLSGSRIAFKTRPNYNKVKATIKDRNIFNSEGEYPDESHLYEKKSSGSEFSEDSVCGVLTLPVTVQGVVLMNNDQSLVALREKGYNEADIYAAGDQLIGQEGAFIYAIDDNEVIFNNNGKKECFTLFKEVEFNNEKTQWTSESPTVPNKKPVVKAGDGGTVSLTAQFVEKQLGENYANVTSLGRFVPNQNGGTVQGFKVFAIPGGSLLSRAGLRNGDIVKSVNDISLQKLEQGFEFFQAFQNETEIRIELTRSGKPISKTVRIN